jgi:endonuclease/exonuclease/phosphatase (EEP) superfamily protein YafD
MIDGLAIGFSALIVLVTVLPFSRSEWWWVRCWDFPRLQLALFALVAAVASWFVLDRTSGLAWVVLIANLACFVYQACRILPYTRLFPREVKQAGHAKREARLRILSSNVLKSNRRADLLLKEIRERDPDVIVTLESDRWWEQQLNVLEAEYPHVVRVPLENTYGMHVFSRLQMEDTRVEFLVEAGVPSVHTKLVLPTGQRVNAHFLHPEPPSPTENERSTERDAELILVAKRVAKEKGPVVVTGDLNDVAWSATTRLFRKLSRLLDPRIGRGMFNTFHAHWFFMRWPLDHLFHSDQFTLVEMRRLRWMGSDHFPIFVDLALEPEKAAEQEAPHADQDDKELAEEKLEHAGKSGRA